MSDITLSKWSLLHYKNDFYLTGIADKHPKLGVNVMISSTSTILESTLEDDVLTCKTRNSIYKCPLKYINTKDICMANDLQAVKSMGVADALVMIYSAEIELSELNSGKLNKDTIGEETKHIIELSQQGEKELKQQQIEREKKLTDCVQGYNDSIYLEVSCISSGDTLAYNIDNNVGVINPSIHSGMFQNSILYIKQGLVDFRYFPKFNAMEIYEWSDNIEHLYVKNLKEVSIFINTTEIKPDETVEVPRDGYQCGLISPNVVNGNNIFMNESNKIVSNKDIEDKANKNSKRPKQK